MPRPRWYVMSDDAHVSCRVCGGRHSHAARLCVCVRLCGLQDAVSKGWNICDDVRKTQSEQREALRDLVWEHR